jgi:hypothetical protein
MTMINEPTAGPERPAEAVTPEPVTPGPVATLQRHPAQATWARVGLLGIGVAALLAAAILVFGSTFGPNGILAAGSASGDEDATNPSLHGGGPGFPGGRGGHAFGMGGIEITAISGSNISLETEDGWTRTITVDDGTTYARAGEDIDLGDLAVGDTIGFRQTLEDDGTWTIDAIVVVLPHVGGEVTAIDGSTITLERRDGTTATVTVGADTSIRVNGEDAALSDIEVGMFLVAEGTETGDAALDAARIAAGDRGLRGDKGPGFRFGGPGFGGPGWGEPDADAETEADEGAS